MKDLALFLLSGFLLFSTGVAAQSSLGIAEDCGFPPALKGYTVERRVRVELGPALEIVSPQIVERLEDGQNCLNENLMRLETRVKGLESLNKMNSWHGADILELQDKLKQTELDLHTAKARIETLEVNYEMLNHLLTALMTRRPVSTPKAAVSKPQAPVNKPKRAVDSPKDK